MAPNPTWSNLLSPAIKTEGELLEQRSFLDFTGTGVTVTDDPANNRTHIDISGSGGGGDGHRTATLSGSIVTGRGLVATTSGEVIQATVANTHSAGGILGGLSLQSGTNGQVIKWITQGVVDPTIKNLGAGVACAVVADVNGDPVRITDPTARSLLNQLGVCDVNGVIYVHPIRKAFIDVKDFGATGDGVTDDTTAIQAAVAALTSTVSGPEFVGGNTLYFPAGVYLYSASELNIPISPVTPIHIKGAGRQITQLVFTTLGNGIASHAPYNNTAQISLTLTDMSLNTTAAPAASAIWKAGATHSTNDIIRPPSPSNRLLKCLSNGTTNANGTPFGTLFNGSLKNPATNPFAIPTPQTVKITGTPAAQYDQISISFAADGGMGNLTVHWSTDGQATTSNITTSAGVYTYAMGGTGLSVVFSSVTTVTTGGSFSLPHATIPVSSTTGFPSGPGVFQVVSGAGLQTINYTGITPTSFTGCTGGTGTVSTGATVDSAYSSALPYMSPPKGAGFSAIVGDVIADGTTSWQVIDGGCGFLQENGGTNICIERCEFYNFITCIIFDQTEVAYVSDCNLQGINGIWVVSSNQRNNSPTADAQPGGSTNVIRIQNTNIGFSGIGYANGGGITHIVEGCNFEGGAGNLINASWRSWFVWCSSVAQLSIRDCLGEGPQNGVYFGWVAPFAGSPSFPNDTIEYANCLMSNNNAGAVTGSAGPVIETPGFAGTSFINLHVNRCKLVTTNGAIAAVQNLGNGNGARFTDCDIPTGSPIFSNAFTGGQFSWEAVSKEITNSGWGFNCLPGLEGMVDIFSPFGFRPTTKFPVNGANNDFFVGTVSLVIIPTAGAGCPSAGFSLTGIQNGVSGRILRIVSINANAMTLTNEDAGSSAANRIRTPGGVSLVLTPAVASAYVSVDLVYEPTLSRWLVTGSAQ